MSRLLSKNFIACLQTGLLSPLLKRVKEDDTLMLSIRDNYINIYYRGGNIVRVIEKSNNIYDTQFNANYNKTGKRLPILPSQIKTNTDIQIWIDGLPYLKEIMDFHFTQNPNLEKEFQQLTARENNISPISNETEYFIVDIESSDSDIGARFDMVAIRWIASASERRSGNCRPAFIEMKYGDNSLKEKSGLLNHLKDMQDLIKNRKKYEALLENIEKQFSQLDQLGLIQFRASGKNISLNQSEPPEIIFLLANHNPRSSLLKQIVNDSFFYKSAQSALFDLRFYLSSFAGYGLHTHCMKNLKEFRDILSEEPH